jgi:hypothetical protein
MNDPSTTTASKSRQRTLPRSQATRDVIEPLPEFEPGHEEILENLATSGRGLLRFAASAVIKADAASSKRRDKKALMHDRDPAEADSRVENVLVTRARTRASKAVEVTAAEPPARRAAAASPAPQAAAVQSVAEEVALQTWADGADIDDRPDRFAELDQPHRLSQTTEIRARVNAVLDRWADREVATWMWFEHLIAPRRSRS